MAITPKLELRQSQSLLMTPQLRQAINLLQMSNLELSQLVEQELQNNPLLERESDSLASAEIDDIHTIDDYPDSTSVTDEENYSPDLDYDNQYDDSGSDREGYDVAENDYSWDDYNQHKNHNGEDDFDYFEQKLSTKPSLYQSLSEQIGIRFKSKAEQLIAYRLVEKLDPAGYFRGNLNELSQQLNYPQAKIQAVLEAMKTFEPVGIFAENLSECLKLQLIDNNHYDPLIAILLQHLDLLASRQYKELKKICHASDEDLASMINDIKTLNPKPIAAYEHDINRYIIPDVFVRTDKLGHYIVELNSMTLPKLLINHQYISAVFSQSSDKKTARYIKEQISHANFLVKTLHQRATTILRVSEEIVRNQHAFFEQGIDFLKPMALRDIADKIEMHESTVSRVTSNKYMHTPRGLFELKYFFSSAAGTLSGDDQTSVVSIKHKIKQLIDQETADNILSDDKLVEILTLQGIKIARRTIAKYRDAMGIATSGQRKREKRNLI